MVHTTAWIGSVLHVALGVFDPFQCLIDLGLRWIYASDDQYTWDSEFMWLVSTLLFKISRGSGL